MPEFRFLKPNLIFEDNSDQNSLKILQAFQNSDQNPRKILKEFCGHLII